jgi:hypothetical protein
VVGLLVLAGGLAWATFVSTSPVPGNSFAAGSVQLGDNDSGAAMFSVSGMNPGDSYTKCIAVTYSGSLPAGVRLYATGGSGLGAYLTMTVERGTTSPDPPTFGTGDGCGTFTPDAATYAAANGVMFSGTLAGFATAYPNYAGGLLDPTSGSPASWTSGQRHVYRIVLTLQSNDAAQGLSCSPTLTWEARST